MQTSLLLILLWAQTADFRTEKRLTRVAVRVHDAAGQPMTALEARHFSIDENGQKLAPESVGQEELPLDLVLLLDVSHSMKSSLELLASSARAALQALREADRVAVFTFAGDVRMEMGLTADRRPVEQCLDRIAQGKSRSATALYKPVFVGAEYVREASERGRRRALLMVSDADGFRAKSEKETLEALWEADASLYLLQTQNSKVLTVLRYTGPSGFLPKANVEALVEKSGGETLRLRGEGFEEMLRRIRAQFAVYYAPPPGEAKRKVRVDFSEEAKRQWPGAKALGRKEYALEP